MRSDMTLGELHAHCRKMADKYGPLICKDCEFYKNPVCCKAPFAWKLDPPNTEPEPLAAPNWEEMFKASEETRRQMCMKLESVEKENDFLAAENERQRIMINTIETMIGRKFDV